MIILKLFWGVDIKELLYEGLDIASDMIKEGTEVAKDISEFLYQKAVRLYERIRS
ncbi:MAG: hypothetical protein ACLFNR_00645 [Candidatus Paceibacterota bacterium]